MGKEREIDIVSLYVPLINSSKMLPLIKGITYKYYQRHGEVEILQDQKVSKEMRYV